MGVQRTGILLVRKEELAVISYISALRTNRSLYAPNNRQGECWKS